MIYPLQYLRAVAAFSVVVCHVSYYVGQFRGDGRMWEIFARAGGFGVALFFAISGYLMAQLAETAGGLRFLVHRLIRIYPIYWLCVVAVVAANLAFGKVIRPDFYALLLVPGMTRSYVLGVEWTLPFELTFYFMVFVVIAMRARRWLPLLALIWVVAIELIYALRPGMQQGQFPLLLHVPFSLFSLPFAMGLMVPYALRKCIVGPAVPLIGLAAIAANEAFIPVNVGLSSGLMAFGCVLLVATAVKSGTDGGRSPNRPLVALGDWSYALYLCHVPIIMAFCRYMPSSVGSMQMWFGAMGLPLVVAAGAGKIDLAMYRKLKSWVDRTATLTKVILCGSFLLCMLGMSTYAYIRVIREHNSLREIAPLGARLTAAMAGDESRLATAAQQAGLNQAASLKGYFDSVHLSAQEIHVQGWAADIQAIGQIPRMMIFRCGQYLGPVFIKDSRPDVAAVLHIDAKDSGFNMSIPYQRQCPSTQVEGLILSNDGRFAIISGVSR